MLGIRVSHVSWADYQSQLQSIRDSVFIQEQGVPQDLEWDEHDSSCIHLLAEAGSEFIGCARLLSSGNDPLKAKIGRMAVLEEYRGLGIGKAIIEQAEKVATKEGFTSIELSAQCHAFGFYSSLGYLAFSEPYDDVGIPHIDMRKHLNSPSDLSSADMYQIGKDDHLHQGISLLQAQGFLDIFLSQTHRAFVLCIKDLNHPICSYEPMLEKIKHLAKSKRYFKVYILLNNSARQFGQHPLLKLQERLPSFIELRQAKTSVPSHWVFDGLGWLDYEENETRVSYSDRARIRHFMDKFKSWWDHALPVKEGRELHL